MCVFLLGLDMTVLLHKKTSTRLPEALSIKFQPNPSDNSMWKMYKLGEPISPLNVRLNGSQMQHGKYPI